MNGSWRLAVVGEAMVSRPFAMHDEPEFLGLAELLRGADLTYGHLEMNFGRFDSGAWPARGGSTGSFMLADPMIANDLRWLGIDLMSLAHNHSLDFGHIGIRSTIAACHNAGIGCAGTGSDLDEARGPAYVETKRGRVALVSMATGNTPDEWAGLGKETMPGRPGVNALRVNTSYTVPSEAFRQLTAIGEGLGILRRVASDPCSGRPAVQMLSSNGYPARDHGFYVEGAEYAIRTTAHAGDLRGNLRSIGEATDLADLVIVAHHFCVAEGSRGDEPPSFVRDVARACIDAGADVYVAHGWHRTLGIEIYRGKPIVYGIGNFFAQSEYVRRVPYDSYEAWGHDIDRLPTLTPADEPLHGSVGKPSETWWSSNVLSMDLADGRLHGLTLHPVEMGMSVDLRGDASRWTGQGARRRAEGRPMLAMPAVAERVLDRVVRLSAAYGTSIAVADGIGTVEL
jgi:poly-gamma-glutamate synthesis protein (capsule biosynthesis protein)